MSKNLLTRRRRVERPPLVARSRALLLVLLVALGPGLVSGLADNDAGGITTYSVVGAQYGYDLLWVVLASMLALAVTQEIGARLGLATGQGLMALIRENYGIRWGSFAIITMLIANLGDTVAEYAGIAAGLSLFGIPVPISCILSAVAIVLLLSRANFGRVQWAFVAVGFGVSVAYAVSAILAHPSWSRVGVYLVVPHVELSAAYLLAVVGTVGTTITPWGQAFIQSYVADKRLGPSNLAASRVDIGLGALVTNVVAMFIVVACAATLWAHGQTSIASAADAAKALGPLLGRAAEVIFAIGLFAASFLGLGTVPLTSAYATCEAFGWESGLDWKWRQAPVFYGLLAFFVAFAALFVIIPGLPLISVMFLSQVLDGLLLPVILVFVFLLAGKDQVLGPLRSGRVLLGLGWLVTVAISVMSVALVVSQIFSL
ncbi:MAG TPA: Nramp family divalent metal transporter [Actinospica sp.]|nr:Nramp family divalent metal transporter [Actinospica sp.]